jgi:hypothetical protein
VRRFPPTINVFGSGSGSDTVCRIIADKLAPLLGQPVIVEDRPGADGALAALYVHLSRRMAIRSLWQTNSPLSADPFIHKDLNYDPIKDFVPITRVGSFTLMLVVNPKLPMHSVKVQAGTDADAKLGIQVHSALVQTVEDVDEVFAMARRERVDGIFVAQSLLSRPNGRAGTEAPVAQHVRREGVCRGGWPHELRSGTST